MDFSSFSNVGKPCLIILWNLLAFYLLNKYWIKMDKIFSLKFKDVTKNLPNPIYKTKAYLCKINNFPVGFYEAMYFYDEFVIFYYLFGHVALANYNQIKLQKHWLFSWQTIMHVEVEAGSFDLNVPFSQVEKIKKIIEVKK